MAHSNNFNTDIILNEIDMVIKKGLNTILNDYMNRYNLLESTHKKIMQLPSVLNELNKSPDGESSDDEEKEDVPMFVSITDMTKNLVAEEVAGIETKISILEKKYDLILPIFDKILKKIDDLNKDIKCIKNSSSNEVKVIKYDSKSVETKENIKLEIQEEEPVEEEQEEEQVEEQVEVPVEEEQVEVPVEEEQEETESDEEVEVESDEEVEVEVEVEVESDEEVEEEVEADDEEEEEVKAEEEELFEIEEEVETEEEVEVEAEEEVEVEAEEEELFEVEIDDTTYCTNNEESGFIFELSEDGDVGDKVGYFKEGEPFFYADEK